MSTDSHKRAGLHYDRLSSFFEVAAVIEARCRREAISSLGLQPGEAVLDVGCGTGHALVEMARAVGDSGTALGLDLSTAMLRRARARLGRAGVGDRARLIAADAADSYRPWPLDSGSVDVILMSFTLELFGPEEARWVLRQCRRVLRPQGRLGVVALSSLTRGGRPTLAARIYARLQRAFPGWIDCRPIHATDLVRRAGFEISRARLLSLWGLPVEVIVAGRPAVGAEV